MRRGYFSLRFAEIVGKNGKVYAVDVDQQLLGYVERHGAAQGLSQLIEVPVRSLSASIHPGSLNLIFIRNVYHHLDDPTGYFREMRKYLVPGGKVAVIDYRADAASFSFYRLFKHSVSAKKVQGDLAAAGYTLEQSFDFLPEQHFLVFGVTDSTDR
ncbi:MAG TPA: class I SAM-dependent methyltransferase [Methanocella sp.]|nr:class I SAM-dependent methyltransferase [Methanocella sp.]